MIGVQRTAEVVISALHIIGGLSSATVHIITGDMGGAVLVALTVAACIVILALAVAFTEVLLLMVRRLVQRNERPNISAPRNKEG